MEIEKDGDIYTVNLNLTSLELLWKNMNYPDRDIIQFIARYGTLINKDPSLLPSLAEVLGVSLDDKLTTVNLAIAVRALAVDENMGKEIFEGLVIETIPITNIKLKFKVLSARPQMVIGNMMSPTSTLQTDPIKEDKRDDDNEDDYKSLLDASQVSMTTSVQAGGGTNRMIGFQPSKRVPGTGPINPGLREKTKIGIKESYVPVKYQEQPHVKEINHEYIPEIDPYSSKQT